MKRTKLLLILEACAFFNNINSLYLENNKGYLYSLFWNVVYTENSGYNQYRKAEKLKESMCINFIYCLTDIYLPLGTFVWNDLVNTQVNVFMNYSLKMCFNESNLFLYFTTCFFTWERKKREVPDIEHNAISVFFHRYLWWV